MTHANIEAGQTLIEKVYSEVAHARAVPFIVLVKPRENPNQPWNAETIFERMAEGSGGAYFCVLSAVASRKILEGIAADLSSEYRVQYVTEVDKPTRPEVKVSRKGVKVRSGLSQRAH